MISVADAFQNNRAQACWHLGCQGGSRMSALQAFGFGVMVAWTPSLLFLVFAVWRAPLIGESDFSALGDR
jgi:hypothetical protein